MPRWVPRDPWFWIALVFVAAAIRLAWFSWRAQAAVGCALVGMFILAGWDETGRR